MKNLSRISLDQPEEFLRRLAEGPSAVCLDDFKLAQVWGLVGLGALALRGRTPALLEVEIAGGSRAARFAHALGFSELAGGPRPAVRLQPGRTVRLQRIDAFPEIEPCARTIANLMAPGNDDAALATRHTMAYVLVELLRNAVQHSRDPFGGVVAAQLMDYPERPMIQVAVADAGIGIQQAMRGLHPEFDDPEVALERALWPHYSGTFAAGLTGSTQNAGMGLFFIAEMAKLAAGRLLIASRGASLLLAGDLDAREDRHDLRFLRPSGLGFPGTLVAFELPSNELRDYHALMQRIAARAKERTPQRAIHRWLRFDAPPAGAQRFLVSVASEDTVAAEQFSADSLQPLIVQRVPVVLNFVNMSICTQSFLHALLFEATRLAWARRTPIFIENASPAVRSGLDLLESYALGG